ncbi:MAG: cupin domain-containing protein [Candidatus Eisenbacteria bacterium]|uniref:Cupin domain-containing protein n=1 Tax=Eiseniibacteriota bacterium TaxID=2212470 RepID=A0A948W5W5_UNCEI|nr:cupin domain-containing protein [Candidatus Eisenbacteria bacterium]
MSMFGAEEIIQKLQLKPLPHEGGYYRETYRSGFNIPTGALPSNYDKDRHASTAIYYLLTPDTFSALHLLPADELFHFYCGDPVEMLQLHADGAGELIKIGNDLKQDHRPQILTPAGSWQGSRLVSGGKYALMGTTMVPGFEFTDYKAAVRTELISKYPEFEELIKELTLD